MVQDWRIITTSPEGPTRIPRHHQTLLLYWIFISTLMQLQPHLGFFPIKPLHPTPIGKILYIYIYIYIYWKKVFTSVLIFQINQIFLKRLKYFKTILKKRPFVSETFKDICVVPLLAIFLLCRRFSSYERNTSNFFFFLGRRGTSTISVVFPLTLKLHWFSRRSSSTMEATSLLSKDFSCNGEKSKPLVIGAVNLFPLFLIRVKIMAPLITWSSLPL